MHLSLHLYTKFSPDAIFYYYLLYFWPSDLFPPGEVWEVKTDPLACCNESDNPPEMEARTSSAWSLCFLSVWQYYCDLKQYQVPGMIKTLCWGFTDYKYILLLYLVKVSGEDWGPSHKDQTSKFSYKESSEKGICIELIKCKNIWQTSSKYFHHKNLDINTNIFLPYLL